MNYNDIAAYNQTNNICPFCREKEPYFLQCTETCYVIPARAPYSPDHLLIIPKRHVVLLTDLSQQETTEIYGLIHDWMIKLHRTYGGVNLLLRDGKIEDHCGKSVDHLHFHLIPNCDLAPETAKNFAQRDYFDDAAYAHIVSTIKASYN